LAGGYCATSLQRKSGIGEAIDHGRLPVISGRIRTKLNQSKGRAANSSVSQPAAPAGCANPVASFSFRALFAFAAMGLGRVSFDAKSGNGGRKRASIRCIQGAAAIPR